MSARDQPAENNRGVLTAATVGDIAAVEQLTRKRLEKAALDSSEVDASRSNQVDTRQLLPDEDLQAGSDNDWNGEDPVWKQEGLTADEYNSTYEIDSNDKGEGKVIAIFAITSKVEDAPTTEIKFSTGTGGEFERLQIEGMLTDEEDTLLLADPVVFSPTEDGQIEQWVDAEEEEIILHGIVAEKVTETLEGSERFLSDL